MPGGRADVIGDHVTSQRGRPTTRRASVTVGRSWCQNNTISYYVLRTRRAADDVLFNINIQPSGA